MTEYCVKDIEVSFDKEVVEDECTVRDLLKACEKAKFLLFSFELEYVVVKKYQER